MKSLKFVLGLALSCVALNHANAQQQVQVTITSNAPTGGVALTPVWVGFHDGSFDSYNNGLSSQPGLERLAEDGNFGDFAAPTVGTLVSDFGNNLTYVDGAGASNTVASSQVGTRVQGAIGTFAGGPPPIQPGESASAIFNLATDGSNDLLSYASMVLPSNDYYVANGNPLAWDISSVLAGGGPISFDITDVNDAGTEVNDFTTAAPGGPNLPGLFPGVGLPNGQGGPDTGADQLGVNSSVTNPFGNFLNAAGVDTSQFDFTNGGLYGNGIATVTISAVSSVPEPSSLTLLAASGLAVFLRRRR